MTEEQDMGAVYDVAIRHRRKFDDPRIRVAQYKPDLCEPTRITIGLFLGRHQWAMHQFTPSQAVGIIGLLLSQPAVRDAITAAAQNMSGPSHE